MEFQMVYVSYKIISLILLFLFFQNRSKKLKINSFWIGKKRQREINVLPSLSVFSFCFFFVFFPSFRLSLFFLLVSFYFFFFFPSFFGFSFSFSFVFNFDIFFIFFKALSQTWVHDKILQFFELKYMEKKLLLIFLHFLLMNFWVRYNSNN